MYLKQFAELGMLSAQETVKRRADAEGRNAAGGATSQQVEKGCTGVDGG